MAKTASWMKKGWVAVAAVALAAGCETSTLDDEGTLTLDQLNGLASTNVAVTVTTTPTTETETTSTGTTTTPTTETTPTGTTTTTGTGTTTTTSLWPAEITGTVKFLGSDVSSWPVTASLNASVSGGRVNLPYSKAKVWPASDGMNANPWVFVNLNGQWYAATWEYLRYGQTMKDMRGKSWGGHIKVAPLSSWEPRAGERIGLMVSGLARGGLSNVRERSNVCMVTWN